MSYINDPLRENKRNNFHNSYIRNNSDNNLIKKNFINYDKIYNKFLISPYRPIYYNRSTIDFDNQYDNNIYKEITKEVNDDDNNNYLYRQAQTNNDLNTLDAQIKNNNFSRNIRNDYQYLNNNKFTENEMRRIQQTPSNERYSNNNFHYNMNKDEINLNENVNNYNNYQLTEDSNIIHDYSKKNAYELNEKELFNKRNDNSANLNTINNNDKLHVSYDNIRERNNNRGYVSPIITQIAKKNFLGDNPYSDKEQNLGPTMLKNNPILYPIDTYKFDFNRYIKGDFVNKFV